MRTWNRVNFMGAAIALLLLSVIPARLASSQATGLQISPTRVDLLINPGQSKPAKIKVKNLSAEAVVVKSTVLDFTSDGVTGNPKILVDPNEKSDFSIKPFVNDIPDFELAHDEEKDVEIPINVPGDMAPAGYFGVVRFASISKASIDLGQTQVALTASVAPIILVQVPGEIKESITLDSIRVTQGNVSGRFFLKPPNKATVKIANTGNSFVRPFGRVVVQKGDKEIHSYEINPNNNTNTVLPKSTREFTGDLANIGSFGYYKVTAFVSASESTGEVLSVSTGIWIIPLWMVIAAVLLLLIIAALIFVATRKLRHHTKR